MLVLALFSASAQSTGFKALLRDNPDPTKAILVITSNHYGALYVTAGNKAYSTPSTSVGFDINGEKPGIRCYYVAPGEYEFAVYAAIIGIGSYSKWLSFSRFFPYRGVFSLEAGKAYHLGYMNVFIPTNSVRGSINLAEGERTCTYETNAERLTASKEYLIKYYPKILNSVNGEIVQVTFSQGHTMCPAGKALFDETFADNSHGWKISDVGTHKSYIRNNSLTLENSDEDSYLLTIPAKIPKSFDLQLETRWTSGEDNKGFGLILGNDDRNCYKFTISGNGYFSIQRLSHIWTRTYGTGYLATLTGNMEIPFVEAWSKQDCIHTGTDAKNVIRVQMMPIDNKSSQLFLVYVNDVLITRSIYFIDTDFGHTVRNKGVIGVYSNGKQNVAFNRLTLSEL